MHRLDGKVAIVTGADLVVNDVARPAATELMSATAPLAALEEDS